MILVVYNMSKIIVFDINNLCNTDVFNVLKQMVSPARRERSEKFLFMEDAKRCICAEAIMRFYLIKNMGFCNSEIDIEYNAYGKPILKGINLYFSLSHSNRWVVCGWNNNEIGVDIEKISRINIEIAKSLFCESEYKYITLGGQYEQYKRFMQIWTLKESYVKYVGKGLSIPLKSFCIKRSVNGLTIESEDNKEKLYLKQVEFSDGYLLAECSSDESCIEVQEITLEELVTVFGM